MKQLYDLRRHEHSGVLLAVFDGLLRIAGSNPSNHFLNNSRRREISAQAQRDQLYCQARRGGTIADRGIAGTVPLVMTGGTLRNAFAFVAARMRHLLSDDRLVASLQAAGSAGHDGNDGDRGYRWMGR